MDSNKTNTISFTIDKLKSVVAKLNSLTDADSLDDKEQEKTVADIKKKINYIKKHCMECKGNLNLMSDSLIEILDLSSKFYKTYGDELTETIWSLYNDTDFILDVEDHLSSYEFFMHIFFLQSKKFHLLKEKNLIIIDISSNNIKANYNTKEIKELYHLPKEDNKERSVSYVNFLLDLILFKILSSSEVKHLYVSLSSFLVSIESSVMKFYKIISLFAIILWTLPDKENFANSLLYVIGGVMRDLGRSYLKTKGILNESLSYHNCKQASNHQTSFFPPKILTSKECSYLELYFLNTLKNFIECIMPKLEEESMIYWDDFISLYYKQMDLEELDSEDVFPPRIEMFHYLTLFLCDFYFFFITNFSNISHDCMTSNFSNLDEFMQFTLRFISSSCRNPFSLYSYSEKKRKVLEMECEKTEYTMKDVFNHYGLSLIFYYFISAEFKNMRLLPLVVSKEVYQSVYQTCLLSILSFENSSQINFMKEYKYFIWNFLEKLMYVDLIPAEINISSEQSKLIKCIIKELSKIENIQNNVTMQRLIQSIKDMDKFLTEMLKMEDINTDQVINLFHLNEMNKAQLNELCLFEVLQELCKKCLILNEEIFAKFVNMTVTSNKETLHRLINDYINEIKTLGTNENEKLSKYRHEILSKLEKLL